jgi:hypothetical protein
MPGQKIILAFCLMLVSSSLRAQRAVPPPPRPQPDGPSLASILDSLKQTLLSSGELTYKLDSSVFRSRMTDVAVNAAECRLRITSASTVGNLPTEETTYSYFLETIDSAEVVTLQESYSRTGWRGVTVSGGYQAMLNGSGSSLIFADRATAMRVAELLRHASSICRATPLPLNAAAGKPTLSETLRFVEQKLNDEAAVSYQSQPLFQDPEAATTRRSERVLDAHADPDACLLRFRISSTVDNKPPFNSNVVLSFRRVQKLEVMTLQQADDQRWEKANSTLRYRLTPDGYLCRVTYSGGRLATEVDFPDEDMANRVAKAMNHAAELCSGEKKEPF